jgi:hypothetical protein
MYDHALQNDDTEHACFDLKNKNPDNYFSFSFSSLLLSPPSSGVVTMETKTIKEKKRPSLLVPQSVECSPMLSFYSHRTETKTGRLSTPSLFRSQNGTEMTAYSIETEAVAEAFCFGSKRLDTICV